MLHYVVLLRGVGLNELRGLVHSFKILIRMLDSFFLVFVAVISYCKLFSLQSFYAKLKARGSMSTQISHGKVVHLPVFPVHFAFLQIF